LQRAAAMTMDRLYPTVRLRFSDGVERSVETAPDETVLAAALRAGMPLVHQCEGGSCGTCVARLEDGETANLPGRALALLPGEIRDGYRLTCSVVPEADCTFTLSYPSTLLDAPQAKLLRAKVAAIDWVAETVARLELQLDRGADFSFASGQYVRIRVPGTDHWRSYSMAASAKGLPKLHFLIRHIEGGAMSSWLRDGCAKGETVEIEGPLGSFGLAETKGPLVMVAGGTGLAPMLAMLETLRTRPGPKVPILLCFGCSSARDLFHLDELELRRFWMPNLATRIALMEPPEAGFDGGTGTALSLLDDADLARDGVTAYLCGPPAMIEAARERLLGAGIPAASILAEHFRPT
jgi:ferredoxin-NADP reductase/ferredoxin